MSNNSSKFTPNPANQLSVRGLGKRYGQVDVLADFNLDVEPGEIVALLGENGAGKSTASAIIAGAVSPSSGEMFWGGRPYAPTSPGSAIAHGIGLIHQEMRLLPELSVAENVFVGRLPVRGGKVDRREMNRLAGEQLQRLGLDIPLTKRVKSLSIAAQQQVEIAKALCLHSRLLILDEPTTALGAAETDRLFAQIHRLREEGVSFIYISHRLDEISRIADRVVVLRDGRIVAQHDNAQKPIHVLIKDMVGRGVDRIFPEQKTPQSKVVIEVESLGSATGDFVGINFNVRAGEIFGVAGIVGAGRTELMRAVAGAEPAAEGAVKINGQLARLSTPSDAMRAGITMVPEDRKRQGLILEHTVSDNIAIGNFDIFAKNGWTRTDKIAAFSETVAARVGVKGGTYQKTSELSGGNQQKTVISRCIARAPQVLILDEPTRGIDVGSRAAIYGLIANLASVGTAVLLVSSDLEEVLGMSHRILVLSRGRQRGILDKFEATRETVMNLATT